MDSLNSYGIKSIFLSHVLLNREMGMIHSIFSNSFNLLFRKQLVHVGKEHEGVSAFGLVLPEHLVNVIIQTGEVGNRVIWNEEKLAIYTRSQTFEINTKLYEIVDCRVPIVSNGVMEFLEKLKLFPIAEKTDVLKTEQDFLKVKDFLAANLDDSDFQNDFIRHFIGRGRGLTPSGDDLLMGIMLGVLAFGGGNWVSLLKQQLRTVQTTYVSHAYYEALLEGYTSSFFVELLQAVGEQKWEKLDLLIEKISTYGHTSGWDTLCGLHLYLENKKGEMLK